MNASFLWVIYPQITNEHKWNLIKQYRNELLSRCDWTQLPDVPLTIEEKLIWQSYRQELRDITNNFTNPDDVVFPSEPI